MPQDFRNTIMTYTDGRLDFELIGFSQKYIFNSVIKSCRAFEILYNQSYMRLINFRSLLGLPL